jgi:hypothetical protein
MSNVCMLSRHSYKRRLARLVRETPPRLIWPLLTNVRADVPVLRAGFPISADIFRAHRQRSEIDAEEAAESLYDLVEKAPSYWQDLNEPVDRVLTT